MCGKQHTNVQEFSFLLQITLFSPLNKIIVVVWFRPNSFSFFFLFIFIFIFIFPQIRLLFQPKRHRLGPQTLHNRATAMAVTTDPTEAGTPIAADFPGAGAAVGSLTTGAAATADFGEADGVTAASKQNRRSELPHKHSKFQIGINRIRLIENCLERK